jgi:hypothetical protein
LRKSFNKTHPGADGRSLSTKKEKEKELSSVTIYKINCMFALNVILLYGKGGERKDE